MKAIKRASGDQTGLLSVAGTVVSRSGVPSPGSLHVNIAIVAFLAVPHEGDLLPSGEKEAPNLWPEKLVKGTISKP